MNIDNDEQLRQKLIDHIHRPIGWAKVGKHADVYAMDIEKTDNLASDMADYAIQVIAAQRQALRDEVIAKLPDTKPIGMTPYPDQISWARGYNDAVKDTRSAISTIFEGSNDNAL